MPLTDVISLQCQLLTGSYEGATRSCPCKGPDKCMLSKKERVRLARDPKVIERRKENHDEFIRNRGT